MPLWGTGYVHGDEEVRKAPYWYAMQVRNPSTEHRYPVRVQKYSALEIKFHSCLMSWPVVGLFLHRAPESERGNTLLTLLEVRCGAANELTVVLLWTECGCQQNVVVNFVTDTPLTGKVITLC